MLVALSKQGPFLSTIVNSNNLVGSKSIEVITALMSQLNEICVHNPRRDISSVDLHRLLDSVKEDGAGLMKLKLSKMNLNDALIFDKIVNIQIES